MSLLDHDFSSAIFFIFLKFLQNKSGHLLQEKKNHSMLDITGFFGYQLVFVILWYSTALILLKFDSIGNLFSY